MSELGDIKRRLADLEELMINRSERISTSVPTEKEGIVGSERFVRINDEYRLYRKFPDKWRYAVMYVTRPDEGPATSLDELSDVTLGTPSSGQVLKYSTGGWINDTSPITAHDIQSVSIHTASGLTPGHFLKASGATTFSFAAHGLGATDVGAVDGPGSSTDNAIARYHETTGHIIQDSLVTINDSGTINIPSGQTYNIDGSAHTHDYSAVFLGISDKAADSDKLDGSDSTAFAAASHNHAATEITSGTLDGDLLPAMSETKKGGVPATGVASGKYLKDDGSWDTPTGGAGDVTGPASSVDNEIARYHETSGKIIQASAGVTISDAGTINIPSGQTYNINGSAHVHNHNDLINKGIYSHSTIDNHIVAASGTVHLPSMTGNSGKILGNNGIAAAWQTAGAGDVTGPAASIDNEIVRYHGTGGKTIQQSAGVTIDDSGTINIPAGQTYNINGSPHTHSALGDFSGPGSSTANAVVRFSGTGGKTGLNSVMVVSDTGVVTGVAGMTSSDTLHVNKSNGYAVSNKLSSGDSYYVAALGNNGTVGVLYLNDDVSGAPWAVSGAATGIDFGGAHLITTSGVTVDGVAGTAGTITLVSNLQYSTGTLQMKTIAITVNGGVVTVIGAESGWSNVPSV